MSTLKEKIIEMIPGTPAYEALVKSQRKAISVMAKWTRGETVSSTIRSRLMNNRDMYLGKNNQMFNASQTEGELKVPVNVTSTAIDLMVFLLSNSPPSIQATPATTDRLGQLEASVGEDLANKALKLSGFHKKFKNSIYDFLLGGFFWWYPFWNTEKRFGKPLKIADFTKLNPMTTRVFFSDDNYEDKVSFVTFKRKTPETIFREYNGFVARPDSENVFLPKEVLGDGVDLDKTSVFKEYDEKNITTIIDGRVARVEKHDFDFTPLIQGNNKYVLNEAFGLDEVYRMLPVAQELNMLIAAASEIARDLAWPALIEENGALGGRKLPKMRGNKIPIRRTDKGETLRYLINPAQVAPLLKQIELLLDLFHFVSLMPKAAAGIFDSSVTSGFQARIAMQPATLNTENKRIDINEAVLKLVKSFMYMIEKHDPEALKVDDNTRIQDIHDLEFKIVWPDNLPVDVAREIQNIVLGIQNSLTSVTQSIDKYNTISGLGSTEETLQYLQQEAGDPGLAPERALKVAEVKKTLADIQVAMDGLQNKVAGEPSVAVPEDQLPGGNATNAARAGEPGAETIVPDTAREAVVPESAGGEVVAP